MKITLNTNDIVNRLMRDDNARWTRSGAYALAQHLEEMEDEADEEMEFDIVAIRCDYAEYTTAAEAAGEYGWAPEPDEYDEANEAAALSWLQDRTSVITFDGGVIIAQF